MINLNVSYYLIERVDLESVSCFLKSSLLALSDTLSAHHVHSIQSI